MDKIGLGHLHITPTGTLIMTYSKSIGIKVSSYNSIYSSRKSFYENLEFVCGSVCPFIQKSIFEVRQ